VASEGRPSRQFIDYSWDLGRPQNTGLDVQGVMDMRCPSELPLEMIPSNTLNEVMRSWITAGQLNCPLNLFFSWITAGEKIEGQYHGQYDRDNTAPWESHMGGIPVKSRDQLAPNAPTRMATPRQ
jgi:hypothetical protein